MQPLPAAAGRFLAALGSLLRSPGLAKLGAGLVARAVEQVPRLSEKVLGAQEAALRWLRRASRSSNAVRASSVCVSAVCSSAPTLSKLSSPMPRPRSRPKTA